VPPLTALADPCALADDDDAEVEDEVDEQAESNSAMAAAAASPLALRGVISAGMIGVLQTLGVRQQSSNPTMTV
jgi:hypothetical protein